MQTRTVDLVDRDKPRARQWFFRPPTVVSIALQGAVGVVGGIVFMFRSSSIEMFLLGVVFVAVGAALLLSEIVEHPRRIHKTRHRDKPRRPPESSGAP